MAGTETSASIVIDTTTAKRTAKENLPAFMNQPPCEMRSFGIAQIGLAMISKAKGNNTSVRNDFSATL
jgi:hypothetical protein